MNRLETPLAFDLCEYQFKNESYFLDYNGFTIVSNGKEPFFSVFPEPAEGYGYFLSDKDELQKIFAALSCADTMNALIYLYQKNDNKRDWL